MSYHPLSEHVLPPTQPVLIDVSGGDWTAANQSEWIRGISIGTAGTLKVDTPNATGITIPTNCLGIGAQHALWITKIYQTGTTASRS